MNKILKFHETMRRSKLALFAIIISLASVAPSGFSEAIDFNKSFGDVSDEVVLKIGEIGISQYTVQKNFREFMLSQQSAEQAELTQKPLAIENWIETFIDSRFLVAEGFRRGLNKSKFTLKNLGIMERHLLSDPQADGFDLLLRQTASDDGVTFTDQEWKFQKATHSNEHIEKRIEDLSIKYNDVGIDKFVERLPPFPTEDFSISDTWITGIESTPLAEYLSAGNKTEFTIGNFAEYFNKEIFRTHPNDTNSVKDFIAKWLVQDLDLEEAISRGFAKNLKFKQDRENYIHKLIVEQFSSEIISPTVSISESEVRKYYDENVDEFQGELEVIASIERYNSWDEAAQRFHTLMTEKKVESKTDAITITRGSTNTTKAVRDMAFSLPVNSSSHPFSTEDGFTIIRKHSIKSNGTIPFEYTKSDIHKLLLAKKVGARIKDIIGEAKKSFTVSNKIDHSNLIEFSKSLIPTRPNHAGANPSNS